MKIKKGARLSISKVDPLFVPPAYYFNGLLVSEEKFKAIFGDRLTLKEGESIIINLDKAFKAGCVEVVEQ